MSGWGRKFTMEDLPAIYREQAKKQMGEKTPSKDESQSFPPALSRVVILEGNMAIGQPNKPKSKEKHDPILVTAYFKECGIKEPEYEIRFHPKRKWRFDIAWQSHKLALEVEGGIWSGVGHSHPTNIIRDIKKYNAAQILGWRVLRVVPNELCSQYTIQLLKQAML